MGQHSKDFDLKHGAVNRVKAERREKVRRRKTLAIVAIGIQYNASPINTINNCFWLWRTVDDISLALTAKVRSNPASADATEASS